MSFTRQDLQALQAAPLEEKIEHTIAMGESFYINEGGAVYYSISGGKDSTVMIDIFTNQYDGSLMKDVPRVFFDTGLEYPEVRQFALSQENIVVLKPTMNFVEVVKHYGYPLISKMVSQAIASARNNPGGSRWKRMYGEYTRTNGKPGPYSYQKWLPLMDLPIKISNDCCNVMKKYPVKKYERATKRHAITATTAAESLIRTQAWIGKGCNAYSASGVSRPISNPMSAWLEQDVLHYIKKYNVKIASVYGDVEPVIDGSDELHCTGCDRTGCMFCAFGLHSEKGETRFQRLAKTHPHQYEFCMGGGEWEQQPDGSELWVPNYKGLGMAKVFDMCNEIYGKDFYRY